MTRSGAKAQSSLWPAICLLLLAIAVGAVRSLGLDHRPFHGDEANQAYKAGKLLETGRYQYDPHDHHGPTLYYLGSGVALASGVTSFDDTDAWMYRIVPVIFSVFTLLLLIPARNALGGWGSVCAALILGVSPAFTFYSRYFIQETLLVCFTFAAIVCGWRYLRKPGYGWAAGLGVSLGLMHATKETAVLAFVAMLFAFAITALWQLGWTETLETIRYHIKGSHMVIALLVAVGVSITLFSAFFTHWRGPLDSVLAFANYVQRADGAGIHDKPWYYYLRLLSFTKRGPGPWWSEVVVLTVGSLGIVLALVGKGLRRGNRWFLRFLALYTIVLTAFYAAIPYKTPWSLLSFYFGFALMAGVVTAAAIGAAPKGWRRALVIVAFAIALGHLGLQSYRAETVYAADVRNPYVYAHTSSAFMRLVDRIDDLARINPEGRDLFIRVIQPDGDYWPLPWYLRRFSRVGYWREIPENVDADVIIADPKLRETLESHMTDRYFGPEMYSLRPGVLRAVYIREPLWDAFMASRANASTDPARAVTPQ